MHAWALTGELVPQAFNINGQKGHIVAGPRAQWYTDNIAGGRGCLISSLHLTEGLTHGLKQTAQTIEQQVGVAQLRIHLLGINRRTSPIYLLTCHGFSWDNNP